jgi:hypothetical protein
MKVVSVVLLALFLVSFASAECPLTVSMVNQDPYPAVPGDYVKLVFQVDGIENQECDEVSLELVEKYPIIFDPSEKRIYEIQAGAYIKDYNTFLSAPYKVRIDENALEGENLIEVKYRANYRGKPNTSFQSKQFNLEVQDVKADFEITIKNYEVATGTLTLEILNIGESDIEALTIEIPDQENIILKGSNRNIVGDLDSNDYTTADFEAMPQNGEIMISIKYTDSINVRRNLQKTVAFDSKYFQDRAGTDEGTSMWTYLLIIVVIGGIIWWWRRRGKKKNAHASHRHEI